MLSRDAMAQCLDDSSRCTHLLAFARSGHICCIQLTRGTEGTVARKMQVYENVRITFKQALSLWGLQYPSQVRDLSSLFTYSPLKASVSIAKNSILNKVDATGHCIQNVRVACLGIFWPILSLQFQGVIYHSYGYEISIVL